MSDGTTYDARVYRTEIYKGVEVAAYKVRWKVGGRLWKEGFRTAAQADSFRSALLTAAGRARRSARDHRQASSMGTAQGYHDLVRVPGTAWTSSCGSTPSASWARTS